MSLFNRNTQIKFIDLAMLAYPVTALTLNDKLEIVNKKGFAQIKDELKVDLKFEKKNGDLFFEKIINSGGYKKIEIPDFIQDLTQIVNDDVSWYNYYETNSEKRFEEMMANIHPGFLVYQYKSKDKSVSYYRVIVRQMASDVVILEVVQNGYSTQIPKVGGVGKFYVKSFLCAEDYDKGLPYPNKMIELPII